MEKVLTQEERLEQSHEYFKQSLGSVLKVLDAVNQAPFFLCLLKGARTYLSSVNLYLLLSVMVTLFILD